MLEWYVMHSKSQKEQWLYKQLHALEIEAYYPCLQVENGKPSSYKSKPYFPGYLFVNVDLDLTGRSLLQWIPGSLGLVTFAEENVFVGLRSGDEVVNQSGAFAGYDAIFCARLQGSERVQVLLKVLQDQNIRIDLPLRKLRIKKQQRNLL